MQFLCFLSLYTSGSLPPSYVQHATFAVTGQIRHRNNWYTQSVSYIVVSTGSLVYKSLIDVILYGFHVNEYELGRTCLILEFYISNVSKPILYFPFGSVQKGGLRVNRVTIQAAAWLTCSSERKKWLVQVTRLLRELIDTIVRVRG
jgi:hypothetical protein